LSAQPQGPAVVLAANRVGGVDVEAMTVKELRALIVTAGLTHDDCVEKAELRQRAREAAAWAVHRYPQNRAYGS
jgi:hypothetical protein